MISKIRVLEKSDGIISTKHLKPKAHRNANPYGETRNTHRQSASHFEKESAQTKTQKQAQGQTSRGTGTDRLRANSQAHDGIEVIHVHASARITLA